MAERLITRYAIQCALTCRDEEKSAEPEQTCAVTVQEEVKEVLIPPPPAVEVQVEERPEQEAERPRLRATCEIGNGHDDWIEGWLDKLDWIEELRARGKRFEGCCDIVLFKKPGQGDPSVSAYDYLTEFGRRIDGARRKIKLRRDGKTITKKTIYRTIRLSEETDPYSMLLTMLSLQRALEYVYAHELERGTNPFGAGLIKHNIERQISKEAANRGLFPSRRRLFPNRETEARLLVIVKVNTDLDVDFITRLSKLDKVSVCIADA